MCEAQQAWYTGMGVHLQSTRELWPARLSTFASFSQARKMEEYTGRVPASEGTQAHQERSNTRDDEMHLEEQEYNNCGHWINSGWCEVETVQLGRSVGRETTGVF